MTTSWCYKSYKILLKPTVCLENFPYILPGTRKWSHALCDIIDQRHTIGKQLQYVCGCVCFDWMGVFGKRKNQCDTPTTSRIIFKLCWSTCKLENPSSRCAQKPLSGMLFICAVSLAVSIRCLMRTMHIVNVKYLPLNKYTSNKIS